MSGSSSRGGAREGSGRKRKFQSGGVATNITVPEEHKVEMRQLVALIDDLVAAGFTIEQIKSLLMESLQK